MKKVNKLIKNIDKELKIKEILEIGDSSLSPISKNYFEYWEAIPTISIIDDRVFLVFVADKKFIIKTKKEKPLSLSLDGFSF